MTRRIRNLSALVFFVCLLSYGRVAQGDPAGCDAAPLWFGTADGYACYDYGTYADVEVQSAWHQDFCTEWDNTCSDFCNMAFPGWGFTQTACFEVGGGGYYACQCIG